MTEDTPPFDTMPTTPAPLAPDQRGVARYGVELDQRLVDRARRSMQGLARGNGVDTAKIGLGETDLKMLRFSARGVVKLVTEYGTRIEPGRNTLAELMTTPEEFRRNLELVVTEIRTNPAKRKLVLDLMTARPDKGFGAKEKRIKIRDLARDFVEHEKCISCRNTGQVGCSRCGGDGLIKCATCQGRRQINCPRCRGSGTVHAGKGMEPCSQCRGDGRVSCHKCAGRGTIKCKICAASGQMKCQKCAGTGWLSHMSHIEIVAQIGFQIDPEKLPAHLTTRLQKDHLSLIQKHDIEVHVLPDIVPDAKPEKPVVGIADKRLASTADHPVNEEPADTVYIDYDCYCPYGTIQFDLGDRIVPAILFGFQARLLDMPAFLMDLTKLGREALKEAALGENRDVPVREKLERAARFDLLKEIITQFIVLKTPRKISSAVLTRYKAGLNAAHIDTITTHLTMIFERTSRKARIVGLVFGLGGAALMSATYFVLARGVAVEHGVTTPALWVLDAAVALLCAVWGILGTKIAALLQRNALLSGLIPQDKIKMALPKLGKFALWAWGAAVAVYAAVLLALVLIPSARPLLPEWLAHLL